MKKPVKVVWLHQGFGQFCASLVECTERTCSYPSASGRCPDAKPYIRRPRPSKRKVKK